MKFSVNTLCPCDSQKKYKKCCKVFHDGKIPSTALELMKSRYSAYAVGNWEYIIQTTHVNNPDYSSNRFFWESSIKQFIKQTNFNSLEIKNFTEGLLESFVTFRANIDINKVDSTFEEKSKFVKENNKWFYLSGEFSQ